MHTKLKHSLRAQYAIGAINTICLACIISLIIVLAGVTLFYHGKLTLTLVIVVALLTCTLCMIIGGGMLWVQSNYFTKPIKQVSDTVKEVAKGNFDVQVIGEQSKKYHSQVTNEMDELIANVNQMTSELRGMDYMRKDFMSNVSHEVKTPAAAILGFSELLLDDPAPLTADQIEYLGYINEEALRLSGLCENMLQMSRLDYQHIVKLDEPVRLDEQLRKSIIMLTEKWAEKPHDFNFEAAEMTIQSNAGLLMHLWTNLLDNAIKYSPAESTIAIHVVAEKSRVKVVIQDQGIGMNADQQERIFEKFYQAEESHKKQGSGLGLSIVKRIVELLQGEITCRSEKNVGTTMTVTLPKND